MSEPPRLVLPWDVLLHVVHVADPPALAALSRVSYDLLVEAAPLLYRSIEIKTSKQLVLLLCESWQYSEYSRSTRPNRITSLLSLSQTLHLTFDFASASITQTFLRLDTLVPYSRFATLQLRLKTLTILFNFQTPAMDLSSLQTSILPKLNPKVVSFTVGQPQPPLGPIANPSSSTASPTIWRERGPIGLPWKKMDRLVVHGNLPYPTPTTMGAPPPHEVVLDLRSSEEHDGFMRRSMERAWSIQGPLARARFGRRVMELGMAGKGGRLTLMVGTEEEKARLESEIRLLEERYRDYLDVEVLDPTLTSVVDGSRIVSSHHVLRRLSHDQPAYHTSIGTYIGCLRWIPSWSFPGVQIHSHRR